MTVRDYLVQRRNASCDIMTRDENGKPKCLWSEAVAFFFTDHKPWKDDNSKYLPNEELCEKEISFVYPAEHTLVELWVV